MPTSPSSSSARASAAPRPRPRRTRRAKSVKPEPVPDLGAKAWYSANRLTGTTEYVVEMVDGLTVVRVTLALPADAAEPEELKVKLAELARLS